LAWTHCDVIVLSFVEEGQLKVTFYGDYPMGTEHLKLEVGIVGDGHELGIAWSAQDGMVGIREVHYFEGECFYAEVGSTSKHHGNLTCLRGMAWSLGMTLWNRAPDGHIAARESLMVS
jgi:hypothetical protein